MTMRVLFDIAHPAHVHLFKHAIRELAREDHAVCVISREKEVTTQLLDAYGIEHTVLSSKGTYKLSLLTEWSMRELRTLKFALAFDPDVIVSRVVPTAVHAATLTGAGSVVFSDTEHSWKIARLIAPLTDYWCTPESFNDDYGRPHHRHKGFHELAYLHPNWFTPDRERLREYGVDPDEPYFVLRFVSMGAHHDVSRNGLSAETKRRLVEELSAHGTVYISSEGPLPDDLKAYEVPIPPEAIHDLLSEAKLMVTDSETMATEAALLGTPTIRSNSHAENDVLGIFVELEERELVISTADETAARETALELATSSTASEEWTERRDKLLDETIDVTEYMLEVIKNAAGGEPVAVSD